ncbi:hypothetical protein GCM10022222_36910 [Amycolatopsis ultiminotia]|uniref:Lsr2 protein n=1 Tax=Amycolatopsis ultiminotia TaxID=543629 RepID=A0ABP6WDE5_9PSEU
MAQKVLVEMIDDLDGTQASQTVPFGLDGAQYEIDLSDGNAAALRDQLAAFIASARRTGGRKTTGSSAAAPTAEDRERSKAIRAWAVDNGWAVSERGRIPANVVAAYEESLKQDAKPARKRTAKKPPRNNPASDPGRRPSRSFLRPVARGGLSSAGEGGFSVAGRHRAADFHLRIAELVQHPGDRLPPFDAHDHFPEIRVGAEPDPDADDRTRHPAVHRTRPAQLMGERQNSRQRRIEGGCRQQVVADTRAEVAGTDVSVEDKDRDQDRDHRRGHPPQRGTREQVVRIERLRRTVLLHGLTAMRTGEHVGFTSKPLAPQLTSGFI